MGDIADMMLDGTLCECCGEYIDDGEAGGYPRYCSQTCAADRGMDFEDNDEGDDEEDEVSIEIVKDHLDDAIAYLEMSIDALKELKIKGKTKELNFLIKKLEQFKEKLPND